jgi:hypothetical protein
VEQRIDNQGIRSIAISHQSAFNTLHTVITYIHHELTPEREAALAALVEHAITDVVKAFVA